MIVAISPGHSVLTLGRPVPALILQGQVPCRVATTIPFYKSPVWLKQTKQWLIMSATLEADARPPKQSAEMKSGVAGRDDLRYFCYLYLDQVLPAFQ